MADTQQMTFQTPPTPIDHKGWKFLICDAPTDANIENYIRELKRHGVTHLVRACEKTYEEQALIDDGIVFREMFFDDGSYPPDDVAADWVAFCKEAFGKKGKSEESVIAVHCVAGLGRAPVLVAIALLELKMSPTAAADLIRKSRRGAINQKQLKYLMSYKPSKGGCHVM
jgi:protein tyrosine phosphatase type IVA